MSATGVSNTTAGNGVRVSDMLAGLSYALDLTEGQRPGHAVRSCLIGLRLAEDRRILDLVPFPLTPFDRAAREALGDGG